MRVDPPDSGLTPHKAKKAPFFAWFSRRQRKLTLRRRLLVRCAVLDAVRCLDPILKEELAPKYRRAVFRLWEISAATWWGLAGVLVLGVIVIPLWVAIGHWLFRGFVFSYTAVAQCAVGLVIPYALFLVVVDRFLRSTIAIVFLSLFASVTVLALPAHQAPASVRDLCIGFAGAQLLFVTMFVLVSPTLVGSHMENASRADATIIDQLVKLLLLIDRNERLWTQRPFRAELVRRLEFLALVFAKRYSRAWPVRDTGTHAWIHARAEGMAGGVREMEKWLVTPRSDTREQLQMRLVSYLVCCSRGDWDALPQVSADEAPKPVRWIDQVLRVTRGLVSAALPGCLLVLVRMSHITFPEPTRTYLYGGAILWAAVSMLAAVDPQYSSKLDTVKGFLPFSAGLKGKD